MATPKQIRRRGRLGFVAAAFVAAAALAAVALGSSVDESIVDTTAPTGSVTLAPGGSGPITINLTVTGNQAGTATFKVYRDWTLSGGTFAGSNPQTFTVFPRAAQDPATTFSTSGTVTVAADEADGTFTLAVGAFDVTNSNQTGAKLAVGSSSSYSVTVETPAPSDTTPPVITPNVSGTLGSNGWYTSDVTVTWTVTDDESAISSTSGCDPATISTDTAGTTLTCSATSAGGTSSESVTIKRDATRPTIVGAIAPASPDGDNGWYVTAPTVTFTCSDAMSGIATCVVDGTSSDQITLGESASAQTVNGTATDTAGNTQTASVSGLKVDLSDPTVDWSGSIADGDSFYFGSVPAEPTCTAVDASSGPNGCTVTGYSTTVGSHTLTGTAHDMAGRAGTDTITYTVLAWTLLGFYQPVDMSTASATMWNTVKGGSTVPLKFEIFAGPSELTSTSAVKSLTTQSVSCGRDGDPSDPIETTATGGTSLRYDLTAGQFVYNWQTPKTAGKCYRVTMTTQDGSSLAALFRLK